MSFVSAGANGLTLSKFVSHPMSMVGSDAVLIGEFPSPRTYGCFPVILSEYVRGEHSMSLPQAIRKMTSFPAQRLGLRIEDSCETDSRRTSWCSIRMAFGRPRHGTSPSSSPSDYRTCWSTAASWWTAASTPAYWPGERCGADARTRDLGSVHASGPPKFGTAAARRCVQGHLAFYDEPVKTGDCSDRRRRARRRTVRVRMQPASSSTTARGDGAARPAAATAPAAPTQIPAAAAATALAPATRAPAATSAPAAATSAQAPTTASSAGGAEYRSPHRPAPTSRK